MALPLKPRTLAEAMSETGGRRRRGNGPGRDTGHGVIWPSGRGIGDSGRVT